PSLITLLGPHINLYIERGPKQGPILEVMVADVEAAKARLVKAGCQVIKDEPEVPRVYIQDPNGLVYNLRE
ncbi:MAG TPA: hypothetical protein VHU87_09445, partial [Rhizomicrobium sp.]|nr:hypothetical protein [Rhizomicrobium sp.]